MENAKKHRDSYANGHAKQDSEDELWYAHDFNDKKDFKRLSSPMNESRLRKVISKAIRESLEEVIHGNIEA